jgi:arylsulfatase A-like enzyme
LVRVPLIVRFPAQIRGGETWSQQVALIDIVPTILGLAGISVPEALEGSDLSEDLVEQSRPNDPPLVAGSYIARGERRFMVRSQNQKLIFDSKGNREELYDLLLDPTESSNEIGSKNNPLYADEYAKLEEVMVRTIAAYEVLEEDQTRQLSPELKQDLRALGYAE